MSVILQPLFKKIKVGVHSEELLGQEVQRVKSPAPHKTVGAVTGFSIAP